MHTKSVLSSEHVDAAIRSAVDFAAENAWAVSVAICDDAGHLLAFKRLPDAPPFSISLALEKAKTAATSKRDTKVFEDMVNQGRISLLSARDVTCIEGGVVIVKDDQVIGAIGVSGVKSSEDGAIARQAVESLALY